MALVLLMLTPIVVLRMPIDILPDINIPVVSVVWTYSGLSPDEMANRIVSNAERGLTITVNDIEHIESQSLNGTGVIKIFFQPNANIQTALAQTTAMSQTILRSLPPGTVPPLVISYSASSTPIVQLGLSNSSSISATISCVRNWQPCPEPQPRIPMAASCARFRSTSTFRGSRPMAFRQTILSTRSTRKT
jgi:multidrug efflux pump subunit AcrB